MEDSKRTLVRVFAILSLITVFGLSLGAGPRRARDSAQQNPPAARSLLPGWKWFRGQKGVIVPCPPGWNVIEYDGGAFLARDRSGPNGAAGALVYVQPLTEIEGPALSVVKGLSQIAPELLPNVQIGRTRVLSTGDGPDVAVAEFTYAPRSRPFQGLAMCFKLEGQGVVYAIAAATDIWPQTEPVMKDVLAGFFYAGAGDGVGGAVLPPMAMWQDPLENAFSVPVPQGWSVDGGMKRFAPTDVRPEVNIISPDRKVWIRMGDAVIPPFVLPTQSLAFANIYEGGLYMPDGLTKFLVMRYLPSVSFLTSWYFPQRVGQVANLQVQDYPELSQAAVAADIQAGMPARADTASATFDAQTQAGPRKGYAFVQTKMTQHPALNGGGNWFVNYLWIYLAEPQAEPLARAVLWKMAEGWKSNPQWFMGQVRTAGQVSQIIAQAHNEIMGIINQTFENKRRTEDRVFDERSRATRGVVLLEDPQTRERFEVPAGSNYYFRVSGGGEFVGTDAPGAPQNPNFWLREMRILR